MASQLQEKEGFMSLDVPKAGKPCQTWYKVIGSLEGNQTPLLCLHGGPGCTHEYLLPLIDMHKIHGIPIIFYDQVGNGKSTHLPEKNGDTDFWTVSLFGKELDALVKHLGLDERGYDLLGQSWGGMLAAVFAVSRPKGLRRLVLSNSPASVPKLEEGIAVMRKELPQDVQKTLDECEAVQEYESQRFEDATMVFYKKILCRLEEWPQDLNDALGNMKKDPTVYGTMLGPSEFCVTGNLKEFEMGNELRSINVTTLLINGRYDEVADNSVQPFFDLIPRVRWITFEKSSHLPFFEERERFMEVLGHFLTTKD